MTESEPTDAGHWSNQMVAVAVRRDRQSFMRIYDYFMPRIFLYLRGLGTAEDVAEDLAQESLLRLWQRAELYDEARSSLSTWLFSIARNLRIDLIRRDASRPVAYEALADLDAAHEMWPSQVENYAEQSRLRERIAKLDAQQARMIRMSYFEAKSHQEIALELGMPLGTVKSCIRRAFLHLQRGIRRSS